MKKILLSFLTILSLVVSTSSFVLAENDSRKDSDKDESRGKIERNLPGSVPDVRIGKDGRVMITGAKVTSVASPVINASVTFGSFVMNFTIKTDSKTQIVRRFSGRAEFSEVGVGDLLSVNGTLDTTATTPTILAKNIRDYSIEKRNMSFGGVIKSIDSASSSFMIGVHKNGENKENKMTAVGAEIKVVVSSSTKITKGDVIIALSDLKVGDKVLVARGVLDTVSKALQASEVRVYAPKIDADKTVFEGVLKSVAGTTLPTTMVVTLHNNVDFTVSAPAGISILNKKNMLIPMSSIAVNDNIQIFGSVNATSSTINATLLRDLSR